MIDAELARLAEAAGLMMHWTDYRGRPREVSAEALKRVLAALQLPADTPQAIATSLAELQAERDHEAPPLIVTQVGEPTRLPSSLAAAQAQIDYQDGGSLSLQIDKGVLPAIDRPGYHQLAIGAQRLLLAVAPARCPEVPLRGGLRAWGLAAQVYSLRRDGDGGFGDFTALGRFAQSAAAAGADALAVSPLHALFAADPHHYSPYSPSSRLLLNIAHIDPAAVFGEARIAAIEQRLQLAAERARLEALTLIDWPAAMRCKLAVLQALWQEVGESLRAGLGDTGQDYAAFVAAGGVSLRDHARFEALQAAQLAADPKRWHWRDWPDGLDDPHGPAVAAFAELHADEVAFHLFLQWLADRGLAAAQSASRAAGMQIGLIADLAVGTSNGGSYAWSRRNELLGGVAVGAPPDDLNALGQNWGLTALSPRALRRHGYAPFIETLRANLRHAGGLRIDHVLGLRRLFLIPDGAPGSEGVYLRYPFEDLLRLIALEAWRHGAIVIGEDLGTVPDGLRDVLAAYGLLGIRVLWFERDHGFFVEPSRWPTTAISTTATHDVATAAGWWQERDLDWRAKLGHFGVDSDEAGERQARERDRHMLWGAFVHAGVAAGEQPPPGQMNAVVDAADAYVALAPSPLALIPVEDIVGTDQQPNLPGTIDEHPNWRRRMPSVVGQLLNTVDAQRRLALVREARRIE